MTSKTLVGQIAAFAQQTTFDSLPAEVVEQSKRLILDSIGCALAGANHKKGKIGVQFADVLGGEGKATIIGSAQPASLFAAAFANSELINALDYDAILPPGHVSPYVLPGIFAIAEQQKLSGKDVITATAIAHELSYRLGKAMDYLRDVKDGKVTLPKVFGYSGTIIGATAAIGSLKQFDEERLATAIAISCAIVPVNSMMAWMQHAPSPTFKYLLGGWLVQGALTGASMAELGHRGDTRIMDDEYGFRTFIGTDRWKPEEITDGLGHVWRFPKEQAYKPYPHCRILHAPLDAISDIVRTEGLRPEEIDSIRVMGEAFVLQPVWTNNEILEEVDGEFSINHGLALGAHLIPPGARWQDPEVVFDPSVLKLMEKMDYRIHPDYEKCITANPSARPTRVEIDARGKTFAQDRSYPKGVSSPDPGTYFTNDELIEKFKANAADSLPQENAQWLVSAIMSLQEQGDFSVVMAKTRGKH